jgi:type II secretory pathway predicted ATPase ExeA
MILDHFGFTRYPFVNSTSPEALYRSQAFQEASKRLEFLLSLQEGIGVLTAEPGVGKSTLLKHFFSDTQSEHYVVLNYAFTTLSAHGLMTSLIRRAGLRPMRFKCEMVLELTEWFSSSSRIPVLVLDEAQGLPDATLEDLRLLTSSGSLILILSGQLPLRDRLSQPANYSLDQRIVVSYAMPPLSRLETGEYISLRLKAAGLQEEIIDEKALDLIFEYTQGVARKINRLATSAMIEAATRKKKFVDERMVQNAQHDIETS